MENSPPALTHIHKILNTTDFTPRIQVFTDEIDNPSYFNVFIILTCFELINRCSTESKIFSAADERCQTTEWEQVDCA